MKSEPQVLYDSVLEKIITPTSLIMIDDDVLKTYINPDVEFSDESVDENFEIVWDHIKGRRMYHLVIPSSTTHITVEVRDYSNPRFDMIKKGEAIVITTLGHRLLAQAYIKFRKHKYPVRIFDHEREAIKWFDTLRNAEN